MYKFSWNLKSNNFKLMLTTTENYLHSQYHLELKKML